MTGFRFSLERVLAWRQMQQSMAEAALERLIAEIRRLHQTRVSLQTNRQRAQTTLAQAPTSAGVEVARLDTLRLWTDREDVSVATRIRELEKAIEAQKLAVTTAARNVRMLERLRARRQSEWNAAMDRELEILTGEWAASQWVRKQR